MSGKWLELAHEKKGHIYPTAIYWLGAQHACKEAGVTHSVTACWYNNHEFSYLVTKGAFSRAGRIILRKLREDKSFLEKIVDVNKKEIPAMLKAAKLLSGEQLKSLSREELFKRWENWLNSFLHLMTWSAMGTVVEMEEPLLSKNLEMLLVKKLGKGSPKAGECFQVLTTPVEPTSAKREELDLLKLRLKQLQGELANEDIEGHTRKYSWIAFGYDGPGWGSADIKKRLNALPKSKSGVEKMLEEKQAAGEELCQQQTRVEKELALSEKEKYLFFVLRTLGFWKFERKFRNQQAHEIMEDFIKELARRNNLSVNQAKMIAPNEMKAALLEKTSPYLLNERIKESVVLFRGLRYEVLSGEKAKPLVQQIRNSLRVNPDVEQIAGSTAYPGFAQGIVKRIDSPEEMGKMVKGNIIVSASTEPDMLPAMAKAAAIVTDTGGITCHAAIIARELRIPTLVGTKFASKILKDNDLVEVNASKGVVKKIESGHGSE